MSMKFHENILNGFQVIDGTQNYHCRISKGNNSKNVLISITVLMLGTSSDYALYFYEVSLKCLKRFSSYRADKKLPVKFQKGITPKLYGQEFQFLFSAFHLMMLYIRMKFRENNLNGFRVKARTRNYHCPNSN